VKGKNAMQLKIKESRYGDKLSTATNKCLVAGTIKLSSLASPKLAAIRWVNIAFRTSEAGQQNVFVSDNDNRFGRESKSHGTRKDDQEAFRNSIY
jgi:hypothetical protein